MKSRRSPANLFDHSGRNQLSDGGPNLRRQPKSPIGIIQLRFAPIIGLANIDRIGVQFGQVLDPHRKTLFQRNDGRERFQIVGSGRLNTQVSEQTFQILLDGLLAMKTDRIERATFLDGHDPSCRFDVMLRFTNPTAGVPQQPQAARS